MQSAEMLVMWRREMHYSNDKKLLSRTSDDCCSAHAAKSASFDMRQRRRRRMAFNLQINSICKLTVLFAISSWEQSCESWEWIVFDWKVVLDGMQRTELSRGRRFRTEKYLHVANLTEHEWLRKRCQLYNSLLPFLWFIRRLTSTVKFLWCLKSRLFVLPCLTFDPF